MSTHITAPDSYLAVLELGDDNGGPVTFRPVASEDRTAANLYYDAASVFHSLAVKYAPGSPTLRAVANDALRDLGETVRDLFAVELVEYADGHLDEATDALGVLGNLDEYTSSSIAQTDTRSGVRDGLEILEKLLAALGWHVGRETRTISLIPDALDRVRTAL